MFTKEKLVQKIDKLLALAEEIKGTQKPSSRPGVTDLTTRAYVNLELFEQWRTRSIILIEYNFGKNSFYFENFKKQVESHRIEQIEKGVAILQAMKDDLQEGFLEDLHELIAAEVFTDFLDMADYLIEKKYKDPAVFVASCVLEDSLRRLSDKNKIVIKREDNIGSLNQKLLQGKIYNKNVFGQVQAWQKIRDSANHGKWEEYTLQDAEDLCKWVRRFVSEYLG